MIRLQRVRYDANQEATAHTHTESLPVPQCHMHTAVLNSQHTIALRDTAQKDPIAILTSKRCGDMGLAPPQGEWPVGDPLDSC